MSVKSILNKIKETTYYEHTIIFCLFLLMAGMSLVTYVTSTADMRGGLITAIIWFCGIFLIVNKYSIEKISLPLLIIFVFTIVFFVRFVFIINVDVQPWNDFVRTILAAEQLLRHDYSGLHETVYFKFFPEYIPWIVFEAAVIKLFPINPIFVLRVLSAVACGITGIAIFLLGSNVSTRVGVLAASIYAFFPESIVFSAVLTSQHYSTACAYLAFVLILFPIREENKRNRSWILLQPIIVGFLLGIGQLFRPDALPMLLAILLFIVKGIFSSNDQKTNWRISLYKIGSIVVSYILVVQSAFLFLEYKNITQDVNERIDMGYKIYMGFNLNQGRFDATDWEIYLYSDAVERRNLLLSRINEYIRHPFRFVELSYRKYFNMWGQYSSAYTWLEGQEIGTLREKTQDGNATMTETNKYTTLMNYQSLFRSINTGYQFLITLLASIGAWYLRKNERGTDVFPLLAWNVLFYVGAFVLIEVQDRYRYFLMPIIILYSSVGLVILNEIISRFRNLLRHVPVE